MLERLKKEVYEANMLLTKHGLVTFTWGNVSGINRGNGLVVIKPSGVEYDALKAGDMVVVDLVTGSVVDGDMNPSSDTPTHLELYRCFENIGGVTHTHSRWAASWAQAGLPLPAFGTTHADYLHGEVPCTRDLTKEEIEKDYELNTGKVIAEAFQGLIPEHVNAVLVKNHGPFAWGKDAADSVHNAVVLEEVAMMGAVSKFLAGGSLDPMPEALLDKHFFRKHGEGAYYGQGRIK
jgi:L-ribulose-5-phosphate 4-epimerase